MLKKILPKDYIEKVNDTIADVTASAEQKMKSIKAFLEQKKTSALMVVDSLKGSRKFKPDGGDQTRTEWDPLGQRAAALLVSVKHSCIKSHL